MCALTDFLPDETHDIATLETIRVAIWAEAGELKVTPRPFEHTRSEINARDTPRTVASGYDRKRAGVGKQIENTPPSRKARQPLTVKPHVGEKPHVQSTERMDLERNTGFMRDDALRWCGTARLLTHLARLSAMSRTHLEDEPARFDDVEHRLSQHTSEAKQPTTIALQDYVVREAIGSKPGQPVALRVDQAKTLLALATEIHAPPPRERLLNERIEELTTEGLDVLAR